MISPNVQKLLTKTGLALDPSATEEQKALLKNLAFGLEGKTADARESVQAIPPVRTLDDYSTLRTINREQDDLGYDAAVDRGGRITEQKTDAFKERNSAATTDQLRGLGAFTNSSLKVMQPQYDFAYKQQESRDKNIAGQNTFTAGESDKYYKFAASQNSQDLFSRLALGLFLSQI